MQVTEARGLALGTLMLAALCVSIGGALPSSAQTRGPQSVAPVAEGLIEAVA